MPMSILVTSTARVSRHVISTLLSLSDCPPIRVIARSNTSIQDSFPVQLRSMPHSVVAAPLFQGEDFDAAFQGVSVVFHNGPAIQPQEESESYAVIDAAKAAGVRHFVLCSVIQPIRTKLFAHKMKLNIEEYLVESRLNYTILQPPHYMQNVSLQAAIQSGKIPLAFSSSITHGFVDLTDLAIVAREVILHPARHNCARYELVAQNISYDDVARIISRRCFKAVTCDVMTPKQFVEQMKMAGEVPNEFTEDVLERLMMYYDRWGLVGNTNVLRWLLGREPTDWSAYVKRELQQHDAV